jgi:hypothetical protein
VANIQNIQTIFILKNNNFFNVSVLSSTEKGNMFNGKANICKLSFLELTCNYKKVYLTADNSTTPVHRQLAHHFSVLKQYVKRGIILQACLAYLPAFDSQQKFQPSPYTVFEKKAKI